MTKDKSPVGIAFALAMNHGAMQKFSARSEEIKQQILAGTRAVKPKDYRYVNSLEGGKQ